jgi:multidrug efflux pump subunit AcrB/outer membrane protein TolC
MKLADFILNKKSLFLTIFTFLFIQGLIQFIMMPREEDPRLKERVGVLKIIYPGASILNVKKLIVEPVEEALAEIPEIKIIEVKIRAEVMIAEIRLQDSLSSDSEINEAWKRIEDSIKKAQDKFPQGILSPDLNRRVLDQDSIIIALYGSENLVFLKEKALILRKKILQITDVSKVNIFGDPEEEVVVFIQKNRLDEKGINLRFLVDWILQANHSIPPGTISLGGKKVSLKTSGWFTDISSVSDLPLPLPNGEVATLSSLGSIQKKPHYPPNEIMKWNGNLSIGLGVVSKKNINLVNFGRSVEEQLKNWSIENADIKVEIINSQPSFVSTRLTDLSWNLLSSILIVGLVLISMMGYRIGILSSIIVPIISIISLGLYGIFGGVLHQLSIVAFIMSMGLLIDNVIVILESIQEKIDAGNDITFSVKETISSLFFPLLSATGTTLAAFIPMLGSTGAPADFTRAIPIINMLTLAISFLFAVFITPILGEKFLRKSKLKTKKSLFEEYSESIGKKIPRFSKLILSISILLFMISLFLFQFIPKKFFPDADRNQFIIDLRLPEGTDIIRTFEISKRIESIIKSEERIKSYSQFTGRTTPLFYYNLPQSPNSPHISQFIVNVKKNAEKDSIKKDLETKLNQEFEEGIIVLQELKQGPPTNAPIELRIFSEEEDELLKVNQTVLQKLYQIPELKLVRSDLSIGAPILKWEVDDASLSRYRSSRSEFALTLLSETKGIPVGFFRATERPIPILLRTLEESSNSSAKIANSPFIFTRTESVRVNQIAHEKIDWDPSLLYRRNRKSGFSILAELKEGITPDRVVKKIEKVMKESNLPPKLRWEFGGEESESKDANKSLLQVAPLGVMVLIAFLLLEFSSWKKTLIILLTVPLSLIGVVPGLLLSGKPFGFLSLLGIFALTGIVVNNGILILDYVNTALLEKKTLTEAIQYSLSKRIRPILLTTLTTIAGLIPLTVTDATLWPPFAWTMISGLTVSTFLTLFVIPAATYEIFKDKKKEEDRFQFGKFMKNTFKLSSLFLLLMIPASTLIADSKELTWKDTVKIAEESPRVKLAWEEWKRKNLEKEKISRAVYYPKIGLLAEHITRDQSLRPNAAIPVVPGLFRDYWSAGIEIQQVLFDPSNWFAITKALDYSEEAARYLSIRAKETSQSEALLSFITVNRIRIKRENLLDLKQNLNNRLIELKRLYAIGQVTESEMFRIEQAISQANIALNELNEKEKIAELSLKRILGREDEFKIGNLPSEQELWVGLEEDSDKDRLEILALRKKISALEEKKKSIEYEIFPKLVAKGNYVYLDNNQFTTNQWSQFSIGISVNPFDGGVRKKRVEETESEIRSTKEELADLVKALKLEKEDAKAITRIKKKELQIRSENVFKSKSASLKEFARVKSGRTNINSWIDAEILYSEEKDKFEMSKLDYLESIVRLRSILGVLY